MNASKARALLDEVASQVQAWRPEAQAQGLSPTEIKRMESVFQAA